MGEGKLNNFYRHDLSGLRPFYFQLYDHCLLQQAIPAFDTLSQWNFLLSSFPLARMRELGQDGASLAFLTLNWPFTLGRKMKVRGFGILGFGL